jgi:hypothetical protein
MLKPEPIAVNNVHGFRKGQANDHTNDGRRGHTSALNVPNLLRVLHNHGSTSDTTLVKRANSHPESSGN